MTSGAQIIPGTGSVVRGGRLTMVVAGSDAIGVAALAVIDTLERTSSWTFENVATALHELVVAQNPIGVSAVLELDDESIVFVFDRAEAISGDLRVKGNGRSGWTTEVAESTPVELRLSSVPYSAPSDDTELRAGRVPGAGAVVPVTLPIAAAAEPPATSSSAQPSTMPAPAAAAPVGKPAAVAGASPDSPTETVGTMPPPPAPAPADDGDVSWQGADPDAWRTAAAGLGEPLLEPEPTLSEAQTPPPPPGGAPVGLPPTADLGLPAPPPPGPASYTPPPPPPAVPPMSPPPGSPDSVDPPPWATSTPPPPPPGISPEELFGDDLPPPPPPPR